MIIYIHTSGRPDAQETLNWIPPTWIDKVRLVVQKREEKAYSKYPLPLVVLPDKIRTLSPTRQWLIDNAEERYIVMMDDDLTFSRRDPKRSEEIGKPPTKLYKAKAEDMDTMFRMLQKTLERDGFAHCGISAREGNNHQPEPFSDVTRMMRVLAYDTKKVRECGARFDRVPTKQDFDMTLQLLQAGYPNRVFFEWAQNQPGSNNRPGGCTEYRTTEMMAESAHMLKRLHPNFVDVVQKRTKVSWGGMDRTDVRIGWKKAYNK